MEINSIFLLIASSILHKMATADEKSFSFLKFWGPVSGKSQQVLVSDDHGDDFVEQRIDYVARPDYFFHYGVEDSETGNSQGHEQRRNGDIVEGEYRVLQDDGLVRIVRYSADPEKGFQASVEYAKIKQ
ncbi:cuticle protein 7-like [Euwallacea similis]|uniref:cuticle protein 7-like n=1 Tax=Euwallacea similis TaxID=1736056 RepID=UPI00344EA367